jgi:hypothetical protein
MPNENNTNKKITAFLIIIILIAAFTYLYINLPGDNSKNENTSDETGEEEPTQETGTILTVTFKDAQTNYTLEELESLESFTATATMIKTGWLPTVVSEGPNLYTGVKFSTLLNQVKNLPENYSINVISNDSKITKYNMSQIHGNVKIYNESGAPINNSVATMILAYKIDGKYFTQENTGPLRVVFCNEYMTASDLWAKMVISIVVNEL